MSQRRASTPSGYLGRAAIRTSGKNESCAKADRCGGKGKISGSVKRCGGNKLDLNLSVTEYGTSILKPCIWAYLMSARDEYNGAKHFEKLLGNEGTQFRTAII